MDVNLRVRRSRLLLKMKADPVYGSRLGLTDESTVSRKEDIHPAETVQRKECIWVA